ncbi:twin-arginine translocation signal domain-containing protein [Xylanimonas ulmi]|uniref:Carbohydrate ABC transporter substrate-binding protein (CUT1 family) n=1 Tax=Xylanimonas ulmi TaxID=228973 RepID=A0A4Q7M323_9MICO|nr:twin-arginine translocation signal domain-containing protein [Xylanibacterium ulmi]RZS61012.1 carbohydrate ABC transporter substrate-binding protein (CUT1 family) [Xylanibacterium ulmi]
MPAIAPTFLSRRGFLALSGATALAAGLAACGSSPSATGRVSNAKDVLLPRFTPLQGLSPDLPGSAAGVPPGYFAYPKPFRSVAEAPLAGETVAALSMFFSTVPTPKGENAAWQEVERRLGGVLDIDAVSDADFRARFATTVAGGDLPDLMMYPASAAQQNHAQFLEAACADLTEHLGGDAVNAYPNLAAIPELFWSQCVAAGKLYYLPIPRGVTSGAGFHNAALFEGVGVSDLSQIADAEAFLEVLGELTDSARNRWALGSSGFGLAIFRSMFRVPPGWRQDGGRLVKDIETDEYLAMIEYVAKAYAAGYIVPGSEAWQKNQMLNAFIGGQTALIYDGLPGYPTYAGSTSDAFRPLPFQPVGHDGGQAQMFQDNVLLAPVMVKKGPADHVERVLRVANFLAAPFGSEEYLLLNFGVEGADYTMDAGGNPILTDAGKADVAVPWRFLAAPQQAVYYAGNEEQTRTVHEAYSTLIPLAVADPVANIYSPTAVNKGASLAQPVSDAAKEAIAGRGTVKDLQAAIKAWAANGGDTIRGEYEAGLAQ